MEAERKSSQQLVVVVIMSAFLMETQVNADVYVRARNDSEPITYFLDLMADFGPGIPEKGISGYLHPVKPLNACAPVAPPPDNTSVWIALIARDNCTFVEKVRKVQSAGFSVAVVYNYRNNDDLVRMSGDGAGINIPSVFISWSDGNILQTDYCYFCTSLAAAKGNYIVTVKEMRVHWSFASMWPFLLVMGISLAIMLSIGVFKWCREIRKKRKSRLSTKHLKKIPTKKFKKGDEYDVCAICLDDYEEGDKLRLLPCSHVYHCTCIDPWLTKNKRCCPICKRKVIPGVDPDSDSDTDNDGDSPSERTPLLGGGASGNNNNNRGAGQRGNNNNTSLFDNSGLPTSVETQRVRNVQEATETETDSDSEYGAVGGAPGAVGGVSNTETANQRRPSPVTALQTEIVSETPNKTGKDSKRYVYKGKFSTKKNVAKKETVPRDVAETETVAKEESVARKETVARDVAKGEANEAFEEESGSSDSQLVTDSSSEVYFPDSNRKEEKKVSHVV